MSHMIQPNHNVSKKKQELCVQTPARIKLIFMMTSETVYAIIIGYTTTFSKMMYGQYERRIYQQLREPDILLKRA